MTLKECANFANENPICFIATVEGDQPRVRAFLMWFADESGFYFNTGAMKEMYKQMKANPKVELCFHKPGENAGIQMRVAGEIEFLDDLKIKTKLLEDRPFLKSSGFSADNPGLIVFRISTGEIHFWSWDKNLSPKEKLFFTKMD